MSNDHQPDHQPEPHPASGPPAPHRGWGGEYDSDATAFIEFPPGGHPGLGDDPLAAPGHGYEPPDLADTGPLPTPGATTDPAATGQWTMPFAYGDPAAATGQQTPHGQPGQPGQQTPPGQHGQHGHHGLPGQPGQPVPPVPGAEGWPSGSWQPDGWQAPGGASSASSATRAAMGQGAAATRAAFQGIAEGQAAAAEAAAARAPVDTEGAAPVASSWTLQEGTSPAAPAAEPRLGDGGEGGAGPWMVPPSGVPHPAGPDDRRPGGDAPDATVVAVPGVGGESATAPRAEAGAGPEAAGVVAETDTAEGAEAARSVSDHPEVSYVLRVNGEDRPVSGAWIGESLLYVLRERLGLAGAKDGCSQGECGACSVQVDGRLVAACLVPAATVAGGEIRTVEGLGGDGGLSDVQRALAASTAVQCGFCLPGMAMTVHDLLEGNHAPTELETREALSGNLCRCTGYRGVLDAVRAVVSERAALAERSEAPDAGGDPGATPAGGPGGGPGDAAHREEHHAGSAARIPHQAGPRSGEVS
ncbi:2Fe-2S iron-sulfur cluster-binding protein [Streptomyces sp. 4N509B]|uniref:2Fe-2S iron-sulfur cluster-binding protein n=1 Tax=Streptomyces sp. 4N509B TaxID=3457413 RepID=UPI003FD1011B